MKMAGWIIVAAIGIAGYAASAQTAAQLQYQLRSLENERALLAKNLATSEGWLASAKQRVESAKQNVRTEPVYETRMVEDWVTYANGRRERKMVERRFQTGTRTIQDKNLATYQNALASHEGQVANGKAQLAALDQRIASVRQSLQAAIAAQPAAAPAAPAPVSAPSSSPEQSPSAIDTPVAEESPKVIVAESEPLWKNPFAWLGGMIVLYFGSRLLFGGAS